MATIDISPSAGTPASTGYLIYTDAATGTFKKAPLSALPLSDAVVTALAAKQATLVSGTNIKTINGTSVLGSGDITVSGSGTGLGTPVSFSETIPLNIGNSYMVGNASAGPHTFIPGTSEQTGACTLYYKADGSGAPDTSAWIDRNGGITNYDDTVDMINELLFYRARSINMVAVTPIGVEVVDTTPPGIVRLEAIDATHIEAELDETVTTSGITGWSFKKNGSAFVPNAISGGGTSTLTFTFATSILDTDTLLASYNSGTGDTEDSSSNELVSFTDSAVTNSVDSTAPTLVSATVENATPTRVNMVFNEDMDSTWSAFSAFTVSGHTVTAITRTGATTGYLTVSSAFINGEAARTLGYTEPGSNKMKDLVGNLLATFSGTSITNNVGAADTTAPTVVSREAIDANTIEVTYSEVVIAASSTGNSFNNGGALTISGMTGSGTTVLTFTITETMTSSDTITHTYSGTVVKDAANNNLAAFTGQAVTNSIPAGGAVPLDFTGSTDFVNTVGTKWMAGSGGAAYGKLGKATTMLPSGQDGRIITLFNNVDSNGVNFGFNTANAEVGYAGMEAAFAITLGGGGGGSIIRIDSANGAPAVCYSSLSAGDLVSINRVGSVLTIEVSTDSGATWAITPYTFTYSSAADLWVVVDSFGNDQGASSGTLVDPEGENLV